MWWRDAVVYQIYPRSYADSNGDGVGDLPGIVAKLDHLAWLGVDAIWLSPTFPSPNADWGYDVADYTGVHPELGALTDLDRLIAEAGQRDIRVLLDLVPNHTSIQHPWFRERPDFYVWADPGPDGSEPNNWVSSFGGPAWTLDPERGQYYLHNFLADQPDLDWWNPEVREAFDDILRYWFDRGVAGFRIDVCHQIVKDAELRDNPPATDDDPGIERLRGQRSVYNANRPEVHDVLRRWREVAGSYDPERLLLGEVYLMRLEQLPDYFGDDDELQLAFNFPFVHAELQGLADLVDEVEHSFPDHAWPVWTGSNHDTGRFVSRWCDGDERKARCALMMLLTLRGTPVLYQGDEIGQPHTELERDQLLDPVGIRFFPYAGRDPGRTPIHWAPGPGAGFTTPEAMPWLPLGDADACNVADQRDDPSSMLHLCRGLIALRRERAELRSGGYERVPSSAWVYRRGEGMTVCLNMSEDDIEVEGVAGRVLVATDRAREDQSVEGGVSLGAWEGIVVGSGSSR